MFFTMQIKADSPDHYIEQIPEERKPAMNQLRKIILDNIPQGFEKLYSF